jgi:hypothetical protein
MVHRLAMCDAGRPPPVLQHNIIDRNLRTWRVDFAWPDALVAVEYDGFGGCLLGNGELAEVPAARAHRHLNAVHPVGHHGDRAAGVLHDPPDDQCRCRLR